jgi:hypothetical protein
MAPGRRWAPSLLEGGCLFRGSPALLSNENGLPTVAGPPPETGAGVPAAPSGEPRRRATRYAGRRGLAGFNQRRRAFKAHPGSVVVAYEYDAVGNRTRIVYPSTHDVISVTSQ